MVAPFRVQKPHHHYLLLISWRWVNIRCNGERFCHSFCPRALHGWSQGWPSLRPVVSQVQLRCWGWLIYDEKLPNAQVQYVLAGEVQPSWLQFKGQDWEVQKGWRPFLLRPAPRGFKDLWVLASRVKLRCPGHHSCPVWALVWARRRYYVQGAWGL